MRVGAVRLAGKRAQPLRVWFMEGAAPNATLLRTPGLGQ